MSKLVSQTALAQRGSGTGLMVTLLLIVGVIALGTWAAYTYGDSHIVIDGRSVDQLEPWEVVGGVILGIVGLVIGLTMGAIGLLIGLVAMVGSLALAFAGIAVGLFITAGVVLGPFLLLAAIILLVRRGGRSQSSGAAAEVLSTDSVEAITAEGSL